MWGWAGRKGHCFSPSSLKSSTIFEWTQIHTGTNFIMETLAHFCICIFQTANIPLRKMDSSSLHKALIWFLAYTSQLMLGYIWNLWNSFLCSSFPASFSVAFIVDWFLEAESTGHWLRWAPLVAFIDILKRSNNF